MYFLRQMVAWKGHWNLSLETDLVQHQDDNKSREAIQIIMLNQMIITYTFPAATSEQLETPN